MDTKVKLTEFVTVHLPTNESVWVIKAKRDLGVRYIVFWDNDPEPTVYKASEFSEKFYHSDESKRSLK